MTHSAATRLPGPLPPMHCLLAFEAVARNRQLQRAAHELGLTRSALSNAIALLEQRLRLRLVLRYSPTVELTAVGRQYLAAVQAFARDLRDGLHEESAQARTQLRLSASRALGRLWLAPRLAGFMRRHPRVELLLATTDRQDSVLGDGVDVALRYGGEVPEGGVSVPLVTDRIIAVASDALLADEALPLDLEALRRLPLIEHAVIRWQAWLASAGVSGEWPAPRLTTTDLQLALQAAVQGVGVTLVHEFFAQPFLADGRLRQVVPHSVPARPYHAVVSRAQLQRPAVQALLAWLTQPHAA